MNIKTIHIQKKNTNLLNNVFSNYFSKIWSTIVVLIFIPLYIEVLGLEQFGIIAFFTVLQGAILLLDMGITPTVTREAAKLHSGFRSSESIHNLFRSVDYLVLAVAIAMIVVVLYFSSFIAENWLKSESQSIHTFINAINIMGFVLALRWIEQVYKGAIQGLQDQIWLGVNISVSETLRWGGSYLTLVFLSETVEAFFLWQMFSSFLNVLILRFRLFKILPKIKTKPFFDWNEILNIKSYAAGMFASSILVFLLTQIDKIIVSKESTIAVFSIYMICSTLSNGLLQLINPINIAIFPKMTQFHEEKKFTDIKKLFIVSSQWMTLIILPISLVLIFFARDILFMWTGNLKIAQSGMLILSLLVLANLLNGFMNVPYMVQLAYGWTSLSIAINAACLVLALPAMYFLIPRFGGVGAAFILVVLNLSYIVIGAPLMFRRILGDSKLDWFVHSLALPAVAGLATVFLIKLLEPAATTLAATIGFLSFAGVSISIAVGVCLPHPRQYILSQIVKFRV
jgi:O-antigen/teichoic acid export membrane protein